MVTIKGGGELLLVHSNSPHRWGYHPDEFYDDCRRYLLEPGLSCQWLTSCTEYANHTNACTPEMPN